MRPKRVMVKKDGWGHKNRKDCKILVTDVHAIGQLASVRSLGRANYQVYAMSSEDCALGLHSRYATRKIVCPSYDDEGFIDWIQAFLSDNYIDMIIPSEGFLWAIQPIFDQLSPLLPIRPEADFIYRYINKYDYFRKITESANAAVGDNCPRIIYVTGDDLPGEKDMAVMRFPCFIKLNRVYGAGRKDGDRVIRVENITEAMAEIQNLSGRYSSFLIQEYAPGQKAGVNLLIRDGKIQAQYVMQAIHESPHSGGVASLRQSWHHEGMLADAIAKIRYLGWEGALMVEYRWDRKSDKFALIEINLRFWGYLHLCLYAGIDFPRLLADHHLGLSVSDEIPHPKQVVSRCLTFEVGCLLSVIRDPAIGFFHKIRTLVDFLVVGVSWNIHSDGFFPGDRFLWFHEIFHVVRNLFRRV